MKFIKGRTLNEANPKFELCLAGAAIEFLKCRINDKLNANHADRAHWEKEWRYHLGSKLDTRFAKVMYIKDTGKASEESIFEISRYMPTFARRAANTMAKYLSMSPSKVFRVLDEKDSEDFMNEARKAVKEALELDLPFEDE